MEIIPIEINNELFTNMDRKDLKNLSVEKNRTYICSLNLITKLLSVENRPINSMDLFLENCLSFIAYLMNQEENELNIPTNLFTKFFQQKHLRKYKDILESLNIITETYNVVETQKGTHLKVKYIGGVINNDNGNHIISKESKSMRYKVGDIVRDSEELCFIVFKPRRVKPLLVNIRHNVKDIMTDIQYNTLITEKINITGAIQEEIDYALKNAFTQERLKKRINRILNFEKRRSISKGLNVDRVYSSFCSLSKIARKHLMTPYNCIDLKSSQPLILTALFNEDKDYNDIVMSGKFYEEFYDLIGCDIDDDEKRDIVKRKLYKNIFFGFNTKNIFNKKFKYLFPLMWEYLECVNESSKNDNGMKLAGQLQDIEAELFNNIKVTYSDRYYTLFDAIYYNNLADKYSLIEQIEEFFKLKGIIIKKEINLNYE